MGHSTAVMELRLDELPKNPTNDQIMRAGLDKWHDYEADRWDNARAETPKIFPLTPRNRIESFFDLDEDSRNQSRIIPFTDAIEEKTKTVVVELSAEEISKLRQNPNHTWELNTRELFGENVKKIELIKLPQARAPRAQATEGKTITRYKIVGSGYEWHHRDETFTSQADARTAAIEHMKATPTCGPLTIEAIVQRDTDNKALVTISRPEPALAKVTFKITTSTVKKNAKIDGYIVTFDYHH